MRREWDAGQRMQPLWCWGVTEGTGDQAGHLVGRLTLLWALLHRGTRDVSACLLLPEAGPTPRLLLPPSQLHLYTSLSHHCATFPFPCCETQSFSQIPIFFTKKSQKKPHQGTKLCFKFSLSRTTGFIFALISKLENKPDAAARAAAAPGTACEAQALLTPLTVPRPAFPHPTSVGFKKQPHTDARYTPGRTLPPPVHAPAPEARIPAARRTTEGGQPPA